MNTLTSESASLPRRRALASFESTCPSRASTTSTTSLDWQPCSPCRRRTPVPTESAGETASASWTTACLTSACSSPLRCAISSEQETHEDVLSQRLQYVMDMSPDLRSQCDYVMALKENILSTSSVWRTFSGCSKPTTSSPGCSTRAPELRVPRIGQHLSQH